MSKPKLKEPIVYVDIDDTLISWKSLDCTAFDPEQITIDGIKYRANFSVVAHLRRHKSCGHTVVFWSAGGVDWAERAAVILGIEDLADAYAAKPTFFVDDKPASYFMDESRRSDPEKIRGNK